MTIIYRLLSLLSKTGFDTDLLKVFVRKFTTDEAD